MFRGGERGRCGGLRAAARWGAQGMSPRESDIHFRTQRECGDRARKPGQKSRGKTGTKSKGWTQEMPRDRGQCGAWSQMMEASQRVNHSRSVNQ